MRKIQLSGQLLHWHILYLTCQSAVIWYNNVHHGSNRQVTDAHPYLDTQHMFILCLFCLQNVMNMLYFGMGHVSLFLILQCNAILGKAYTMTYDER